MRHPGRRTSSTTLGVGIALLLGGCGAVGARVVTHYRPKAPFRGVRLEVGLLGEAPAGWFALLLPLVALDLPLTLVLDLLLAPFEVLGDSRPMEPPTREPPEGGVDAWRLLVGGDFQPTKMEPGPAGLGGSSEASTSATGRLRLAAVGGVRERPTANGWPATCGAAISRGGDALLGFQIS